MEGEENETEERDSIYDFLRKRRETSQMLEEDMKSRVFFFFLF